VRLRLTSAYAASNVQGEPNWRGRITIYYLFIPEERHAFNDILASTSAATIEDLPMEAYVRQAITDGFHAGVNFHGGCLYTPRRGNRHGRRRQTPILPE